MSVSPTLLRVAIGVACFGALSACGDDDTNIGINIVDRDVDEVGDTAGDTDLETPDTPDLASDTTAAVCLTAGGFGCACEANDECNDGFCIEGPDGKVCTRTCIESCPEGFDCLQTIVGGPDPVSICVPRHVPLCRPCNTRSDCRTGSDSSAVCLAGAAPEDGSFCATSCASSPCPAGYACQDVATRDATARVCVPEDGSCECRPSWAGLGLETTCARTNEVGTCGGVRACTADGLTACSARLATAEACNGVDDDCDGATDDLGTAACELSTGGIESTCPGVMVCDGSRLSCAGRSPAREICNGIDDDCDGATDDAFGNCVDSGCVPSGGGFVENGAAGCQSGHCVYENPRSCGYFTCAGQGGLGDVCATSCSDDSRCLANATCVSNTCVCRVGYAGATCESCAVGYQDNDHDGTCAPGCELTPCVQGSCDDASGVATCTCDPGHVGAACDACDAPTYSDPDGDTRCELRGEVVLGPRPATIARVGKVYRYALSATQAGSMPDDHFVFTITSGPDTMVMDASGVIAWTPAPEEQTWHEDPAQRTSIPLTVRATAPDGQFAEHAIELEVLPAVFVDGLHPAAGRAGGNEPLLVYGRGFVGPAGSIGVAFGDLPAASVTVIDQYTLAVTTPAAPAMTRPLVIVLDGDPEVELRPGFTHLPVIAFASTTSLPINSNLVVSGEGFDPSDLSANVVSVPGRGRTERRIRASVEPDNSEAEFSLGVSLSESTLATGAYTVIVNGLSSNALPLTITDSPVPARLAVTSIDAPRAAGGTMKLRGAGFAGLTTSTLSVSFAGASGSLPAIVTAIDAAGTEVSVTVPDGAITGHVTLAATGRATATSFVPAVIPGTSPKLTVSGITPERGSPGESLVVRGLGFVDADPAAHTVTFEGKVARVLSAEATRLVVEVPAGLPIGPTRVAVTVGGATDDTQVFGMSREPRRIAGGGAGLPIPASTSPFATPMLVSSVAADASGLVILSDGRRIRALNTTANPITAFGQTIAPGTLGTLAEQVTGTMALRPLGGDLFFTFGHAIWRMRRSDGVVSQYAGQLAAGFSGDGGHRSDASFSFPIAIDFTSDSILLVNDYNNGGVRAINTTGAVKTRWGLSLAPDIVQTVEFWGPQSIPGLAVGPDDSIYTATFTQLFKVAANRPPATDSTFVGRVRIGGAGGAGIPTTGCPATSLVLGTNNHLAVDKTTGDLYIGSRHGIVRRMIASGGQDATTLDGGDCIENYAGLPLNAVGVANPGYAGDGGPAEAARIPLLPRPWILPTLPTLPGQGGSGSLLVSGDGYIRRVTLSADPAARTITTLAGAAPLSPDGARAIDLDSVTVFGNVVVDPAGDRYLYAYGSRIVAQSRTTGLVSVLAGTGLDGNFIAPDGAATASDLSFLRGLALRDGRHLVMLESIMPRVSSVDLTLGKLSVLAGDGRTATSEESLFVGPAATARVDINTGRPKPTIGPDGLLYFANGNIVRVINPTDAPITSFGLTVPAGGIDHLPTTLGSNISRIAFDPQGNLYVASLVANRLARIFKSAPTTVDRIIAADSNLYGYSPPGRFADLRVVGISDLAFMPNGDLLITPLASNILYHVRAKPDGSIDGDCLFASIVGGGGAGSPMPGRPVSAQSLGVTSQTLDGDTLLFADGARIFAMDLR